MAQTQLLRRALRLHRFIVCMAAQLCIAGSAVKAHLAALAANTGTFAEGTRFGHLKPIQLKSF
jgi:hypothetical protein